MARTYRGGYVATRDDGAALEKLDEANGNWTVRYTPSPEGNKIALLNHPSFSPPASPITIMKWVKPENRLVTFPLNTTATSPDYLRPKYEELKTITFDGLELPEIEDPDALTEILYEELPSGFIRNPYQGLGILYELRFIPYAVMEIKGITDLLISAEQCPTAVVGSSYNITALEFDRIRRAINRAHDRALEIVHEEKRVFAHNNLLTPIDQANFPKQRREYHDDEITKAVGDGLAKITKLSKADLQTVLNIVSEVANPLVKAKPAELLELNRDIELVTLQELIARMEAMLAKKLVEKKWQEFFLDNPFVVRLAFGLPVVLFGDQVSVGGRKFSGSGGKIADLVVQAGAHGSLGIIEIKRPDTNLIEQRKYRGDLHAPTNDLSGAVNQVLDQRYRLQKDISTLKDNSQISDVNTYAVQCIVIAGRTPVTEASRKSLELFRNNLHGVLIITFDELLRKLQGLANFLQGSSDSKASTRPRGA